MANDAVILDDVRTAIGTFGGSLAGIAPSALATAVAKEATFRSEVAFQFATKSCAIAEKLLKVIPFCHR